MQTDSLRIDYFEDADDAATAVGLGDVRFALRQPPRGEWRIARLALARDVQLIEARSAAAFSANASSRGDVVSVVWPMARSRGHAWIVNGRKIGPDSFVVMNAGAEWTALADRPIWWAKLQVPVALLPGRDGGIEFARVPRSVSGALREWVRQMIDFAGHPVGERADWRWEQVLHELIVPYLAARETGRAGRPLEMEMDMVRRLNELLRAHPSEPLYPGDLQRMLGLSARGLRRFFQDNFGVSVGRFLRVRRLNNAFRDLKGGRYASRPVTEVAVKHGFFDLGRFASAYAELFGELPSATIGRRATRRRP